MIPEVKERHCASCGSTNLEEGDSGDMKHHFLPKSMDAIWGYRVYACACLDCGAIGYHLNDRDLQALRKSRGR